ncbi:MAG: hypothetical protein Q9M43_08170 [Sulfurimonas sp.]|nr:hypothetical protein [Sulfurimonas sp.]
MERRYVRTFFTKNIFSRHTRFIITSEDSLAEFWEYYLLGDDVKCDGLSDVVRTVFAIGEIQRRLDINSDIFVEESEEKIYFTLSNIGDVPSKIIELTLKKNDYQGSYKIGNGKISFELDLIVSEKEEIIPAVVEVKKEVEVIASEVSFASSVELTVQDYIDPEDLYDLEEYGNKLSSIMLLVGGGGVTEEEVIDIYTYLDRLGSILASYSEVYPISQALGQLSVDMSTHMQEFIDNSEALGPMCKAFSNDMSNWIEMSFHTGAPSATFMNDTIVVNSQTIGGMLKMDEAPAEGADDFDDIFDF